MSRIFILARTVLPTPASFCPNLQILVSWDALDMLGKSNWRPFTAEARRWSQADSISAGLLWAKIEYPQHGGPGRVENPSEKAQGLEPVQTCWNLLEPVGTCWNLLEPVGTCWNLLEPVGTMGLMSWVCWAFYKATLKVLRSAGQEFKVFAHFLLMRRPSRSVEIFSRTVR